MAPSRSRGHDNQESAKKASFPMGDQLQKWKSPFGLYTDSDMLVWLKGLALDPCDQKASPDSARQLWNQSLKVRKFLLLGNAESPRVRSTQHWYFFFLISLHCCLSDKCVFVNLTEPFTILLCWDNEQ